MPWGQNGFPASVCTIQTLRIYWGAPPTPDPQKHGRVCEHAAPLAPPALRASEVRLSEGRFPWFVLHAPMSVSQAQEHQSYNGKIIQNQLEKILHMEANMSLMKQQLGTRLSVDGSLGIDRSPLRLTPSR